MQVNFLPSDGVTSASGWDSQQQITQGLTKIKQHENSTAQTNIKVVIWITKYKLINFPELFLDSNYTYLMHLFWYIFMARQL
jgi:hypothetical protein